jgi:PAS domain S-box-containing protein
MTDTSGKIVSQDQIEKILDVLMDIMRGDFDRRLPVVDVESSIDAIHLAINITAEELARTTVSSQYVESILRSMADMLLVVDPDGKLRTVNDAACEFLGYTRKELLGNDIDFLKSDTLIELVSALRERGGPPVLRDIEVVLRTRQGGEIPVTVNGSVLRDEEERAKAIVLIARDLRRTRELIARAEQAAASEAIIEGMVDAVIIAGLDSTVHRVNRAFESRSGFTRREAIGEKIVDLGIISRSEFESKESEIMPRLLEKGSVENLEAVAISRDGERRPVLVNLSLMRDATGDPTSVILTARDISDRKRDEARIEHLNRVLRSIRNVNQLIVKERDPEEMIENACQLLVETRGYNRAWIALRGGAKNKPVFAQAGWGDSFLPMAEFLRRGERSPCEKMRIPRSGVLAVRNPPTDCAGCPLADCYRGDEAMAVRFQQAGKDLGFMAVSIPGDFVADFEEQSLFQELAEDIGFALYNIGLEEERDHTLEELRQSNERYKTLFDGAAEGIVIADIETQVIRYANPALCKMLGYSQRELQKLHIPSIHPPEDRDYAAAEFQAQARGLKTLATNVECVRKDGRVVYADVNTSKIAAEGGEYNLSFYTDVTERKLAEERVHHLNLVLQAIRNVNQLIVKEKDRDRLIDSACRLLVEERGYGKAWIALDNGRGAPLSFAQAGWDQRFQPVAEALRSGELPLCGNRALSASGVLAIEDPLLSCDGCPLAEEYLSETVMVTGLEHEGKRYGVMSVSVPSDLAADEEDRSLFAEVASDIAFALYGIELEAERDLAEQDLREAEERWRSLTMNIPGMVINADREGKILFMNRVVTGLEVDRVLGSSLYQWVPPETVETLRESVEKVFRTAKPSEFEARGTGPNNTLRWYHVRLGPVMKEGRVESILMIPTDITERKRMEESLRRSEVMSRMGVLLGDFAHEVRNPLFAISATVDAFEARFGEREEFVQYLEVLRGELNRTKNLMQELLEYGKPTRLDEQPQLLDEVLGEALAACARLAGECKVTLADRSERGLGPLLMDRERLAQAVGNVLTNAIQFSREGGTVTLEAGEMQEDGRRWLVCSVSDGGPGFGTADTEMIFEPFFSKRRGGTGLGLTIVRRVVDDHGGEVSVSDRPGGGGMVRIKLPCAQEAKRSAD